MPACGRHRRYRPSLLSRASLTVTGAGLALPLVGASGASAASVDVWEQVATCESSGDWSINTGNGFYGGLQFQQSTWEEFGGTAFAPRADLATKDQQIAVAERVLKGQGPQAWPSCSTQAGLALGGADPEIAPEDPADPADEVREGPRPAQEAKPPARDRTPATRDAPGTPGARPYRVTSGDTLFDIAEREGLRGGWRSLYELNRATVGSDPDRIFPGQRLELRPGQREGAERPQRTAASTQRERGHHPSSTTSRSAAYTAPVVAARAGTAYRAAGGGWSLGYHTGVDFAVPTGTSVKAVAEGRVVAAEWADSFGYEVIVRHPDGRYSQYAHLSAISVSPGQPVRGGQLLGRSGSTGKSSGPHLHFEIRTAATFGSDIDPLAYLRQHGVTL